MYPNLKGSETLSLLATIDPASQAAGTVTTAWISAANFHAFLALVETGVLGAAATLDAKIQQARDATGTGAKDVSGKAIRQIVKASGDNKQALINLRPENLDSNNGFAFLRLSLTVEVAASLVAAKLIGVHPRYATAEVFNQATVVQVI
ncbi:hypothetical protein [Candidatus Accumulibacter sp. ACC012]|uniref:hypothetical protein n=1 Tax=Candidatus Accumulibacter sp. ACC012 TaxID=2823332 RepID=UPI0025C58CBB|nr:hypothetical protein [Candidatus Accumulibacter sp. ACC012]